ncbi:MAG: hypothetical protein GY820_35620 [Gammaproteobacteria bacterium]|nr:hypothetical protein [Gammaproteobacteria bacterium]
MAAAPHHDLNKNSATRARIELARNDVIVSVSQQKLRRAWFSRSQDSGRMRAAALMIIPGPKIMLLEENSVIWLLMLHPFPQNFGKNFGTCCGINELATQSRKVISFGCCAK